MHIYTLFIFIFGFSFCACSSSMPLSQEGARTGEGCDIYSVSSFQNIFRLEEGCDVKPVYLFYHRQIMGSILRMKPIEIDERECSSMIIDVIKSLNPSNPILNNKPFTQILMLWGNFKTKKSFLDFVRYIFNILDMEIKNYVSIDKIHEQMEGDITRYKVSHTKEDLDKYLEELSILSERFCPRKLRFPQAPLFPLFTKTSQVLLWPTEHGLKKNIYNSFFSSR